MKPDLTNIKNIIFDLGKVLLNLDFNATMVAFQELGLKTNVFDHAPGKAKTMFHELETGNITPKIFYDEVRIILNNPDIIDSQIKNAWLSMILDIPAERVKKVQELAGNYKVFLFSNTNQIHIEFLHQTFLEQHGIHFPSIFINDFYSHEIHLSKPNVNSYLKVIELAGVNPEETLFVDDLEKNIEGAKLAGLKTYWLKEGIEMAEIF